MENIPFVAFESTQVRYERTVKRLIIALTVAIILFFASNIIWLCVYQSNKEGDNINTSEYNEHIENAFFSKKEYSKVLNDLCYTFNENDFNIIPENIFITESDIF